jgi:replicative DNA helicase
VERRKEDAEVASVEAEESVVAALFGERSVEAFSVLSLSLRSSDFHVPAFGFVFDACTELIEKGVTPDGVTLVTHLRSKKGWSDRMGQMVEQAVAAAYAFDNLPAYAEVIVEKARGRQIAVHLSEIQKAVPRVGGEISSENLIQQIDAVSLSITNRDDSAAILKTPRDNLKDVVVHWEQQEAGAVRGVMTGIAGLDEKTGGLFPGQLIIVAGRPSMGKTALALNISAAESVLLVPELSLSALEQDPAPSSDASPLGAIFSLEMPTTKLTMRMLSNIAGVEYSRMNRGTFENGDWEKLTPAFHRFGHSNIHISDESYLTVGLLRAKCRQLMRSTGKKLRYVIVDYLQLMDVDGPGAGINRTNDVSAICRGLKKLAKELDCPIIALSQLNRSLEQRADKRPMMSDLRESGAIEQDADIILFIYRDEVYNPDSQHAGIAEIIIGKGRDVGIGMVPARCDLAFQRFSSMPTGSYSYENTYGGQQ